MFFLLFVSPAFSSDCSLYCSAKCSGDIAVTSTTSSSVQQQIQNQYNSYSDLGPNYSWNNAFGFFSGGFDANFSYVAYDANYDTTSSTKQSEINGINNQVISGICNSGNGSVNIVVTFNSVCASPSPSTSPSASLSRSPSPTISSSSSVTPFPSVSSSVSPSISVSPSFSSSPSFSRTPSPTQVTTSPSRSSTPSQVTTSPSKSPSKSPSPSKTSSPSQITKSPTPSSSKTPSPTSSSSPSQITASPSKSPSKSPGPSKSSSPSQITQSPSPSFSNTPSVFPSTSLTPKPSVSSSPSSSPSLSPSSSNTPLVQKMCVQYFTATFQNNVNFTKTGNESDFVSSLENGFLEIFPSDVKYSVKLQAYSVKTQEIFFSYALFFNNSNYGEIVSKKIFSITYLSLINLTDTSGSSGIILSTKFSNNYCYTGSGSSGLTPGETTGIVLGAVLGSVLAASAITGLVAAGYILFKILNRQPIPEKLPENTQVFADEDSKNNALFQDNTKSIDNEMYTL